MPKNSIIPSTQDEFKSWSDHLNSNIGQHGLLSPQEEQQLAQSCGAISQSYDDIKRLETQLIAAIANKNAVEAANLPTISQLLNKAKKSSNYSVGIGKALDIVTRSQPNNPVSTLKPNPKLSFSGAKVLIKYTKGRTEGVRIYCRRGTETSFSRLDRNHAAPYADERPNLNGANSEKREYYLIYMKNNEEVGLKSDIVSINVEL